MTVNLWFSCCRETKTVTISIVWYFQNTEKEDASFKETQYFTPFSEVFLRCVGQVLVEIPVGLSTVALVWHLLNQLIFYDTISVLSEYPFWLIFYIIFSFVSYTPYGKSKLLNLLMSEQYKILILICWACIKCFQAISKDMFLLKHCFPRLKQLCSLIVYNVAWWYLTSSTMAKLWTS